MTRFHKMAGLPLLCAVVLTVGCQNTLTVRVQRALIPSSMKLSPNSRLGAQLGAAIEGLTRLISSCETMDQALEDFVRSFPDGPYRDAAKNAVTFWLEDLRKVTRPDPEDKEPTASELRAQCQGYFAETDITGLTDEIRDTLRAVDKYLQENLRGLRNWVAQAKKTNSFSALAETCAKTLIPEDSTDPNKAKEAEALKSGAKATEGMVRGFSRSLSRIAARALSSVKPGFGGFMSTDVYSINPSDPKYAEILKTHGPWHSLGKSLVWQDVSAESLTKASAGVTGDSAIMFVMEHPGQVRMFQVSLDPTQITSNIGMLISKASAAGAKYMSGGLAP